MPVIELIAANDRIVLVDSADEALVKGFSWRVQKTGRKEYAVTHSSTVGWLYMHHLILSDCPKGYNREHINLNTLDNRRKNLRIKSQYSSSTARAKIP